MSTIDKTVDLTVKRNDTLPVLTITCTQNGVAYDLSTATGIRLLGSMDRGVTTVMDHAVTGDATGVINYQLVAADVANEGVMWVEVEVTDSGGKIITFPNNGYKVIEILKDLG